MHKLINKITLSIAEGYFILYKIKKYLFIAIAITCITATAPLNTAMAKYYFSDRDIHRAGNLFIWVCKQTELWQNNIESYINVQYNGNASLFTAGDAVRSSSYFTSVLGTAPQILATGSESNCPTIKIQLNSNNKADNILIHQLNDVLIKSKASCVNNTITKWTIHTNLDTATLNTTIHNLNACPGTIMHNYNLSL